MTAQTESSEPARLTAEEAFQRRVAIEVNKTRMHQEAPQPTGSEGEKRQPPPLTFLAHLSAQSMSAADTSQWYRRYSELTGSLVGLLEQNHYTGHKAAYGFCSGMLAAASIMNPGRGTQALADMLPPMETVDFTSDGDLQMAEEGIRAMAQAEVDAQLVLGPLGQDFLQPLIQHWGREGVTVLTSLDGVMRLAAAAAQFIVETNQVEAFHEAHAPKVSYFPDLPRPRTPQEEVEDEEPAPALFGSEPDEEESDAGAQG